ncbi:MAG TPA: NAD(P)/FAD-dependent oxidoreductase [Candidatus Limnocylindria bacterium]|nr:NAD(P)/FAD-dependent oxidoreductase [Candidatus Limnocylindria bacterium]
MKYDVIVAGGGMAGLTAAAFLAKAGRSVLLCEKEGRVGGLVGSFQYNGFTFDAGIRALENSGVLLPMLRALGIEVDFVKSPVSIGIGDRSVRLEGPESLEDYRRMLLGLFPQDADSIGEFTALVQKAMEYMRVLYGIENPLFMDMKRDREYLMKTVMPWMLRYPLAVRKINRLNMPVEECLGAFMKNRALVDVLAQHFFRQTPAFFALSYFSLYLDYRYPLGGTGTVVRKLEEYIRAHGGEVRTDAAIGKVDPARRTVSVNGEEHSYGSLIWAADQKALYASLEHVDALPAQAASEIRAHEALIRDKEGGDSVLTLYLTADLDPSYFGDMHAPHFFHTPRLDGLGSLPQDGVRGADGGYSRDRDAVFAWLRKFLQLTTYEISIPALRDPALAPKGKTGLIISALMDYPLVLHIRDMGWYDGFKALCREAITETLTASVYPRLSGAVTDGFVSTPLTIQERAGTTGGAITGWAFTNRPVPAESRIPRIARAVRTPIPGVLQAGQWAYSPSGLPTAILTGKLAADRALKELRGQAR